MPPVITQEIAFGLKASLAVSAAAKAAIGRQHRADEPAGCNQHDVVGTRECLRDCQH
jgi:hypothetical protein